MARLTSPHSFDLFLKDVGVRCLVDSNIDCTKVMGRSMPVIVLIAPLAKHDLAIKVSSTGTTPFDGRRIREIMMTPDTMEHKCRLVL